jgi:tartrate/fumarate subfamily iron-sulfur-dependent hydro-lyase beta chain
MEYYLETPVREDDIRKLKVGDLVYLSGTVITARDEAHLKALELNEKGERLPVEFTGRAVYHCGPVMKKVGDEWKVVVAGPTTSVRMDIFEDKFIEAFRPAMIIGKGGMGERTTKACERFGGLYGYFTGGAAILAANGIKKVEEVHWLEELGMAECLWVCKTENFGPLLITIDTYGHNLTEDIKQKVMENKKKIIEMLG